MQGQTDSTAQRPKADGLRTARTRAAGARRLAAVAPVAAASPQLSPLRGYLERQVGRPWRVVYGEMRARIDPLNPVQVRVLAQATALVCRTAAKVAPSAEATCGLLFAPLSDEAEGFRPMPPRELYVDPEDGLIKRARRAPAADRRLVKPPAQGRTRRLGPHQLAIEAGGGWHAVDLTSFRLIADPRAAPDAANVLAFDLGDRVVGDWSDPIFGSVFAYDIGKIRRLAAAYGPGRLATGRRGLSRRELIRLGLG